MTISSIWDPSGGSGVPPPPQPPQNRVPGASFYCYLILVGERCVQQPHDANKKRVEWPYLPFETTRGSGGSPQWEPPLNTCDNPPTQSKPMQLLAENCMNRWNTVNGAEIGISSLQKFGKNVNICTKNKFLGHFLVMYDPKTLFLVVCHQS